MEEIKVLGPKVESLEDAFKNNLHNTAFLKHATQHKITDVDDDVLFWGSVCQEDTRMSGILSAISTLDIAAYTKLHSAASEIDKQSFWEKCSEHPEAIIGTPVKPAHEVQEGCIPEAFDDLVAFLPGALEWHQLMPVISIPLAPMVDGVLRIEDGRGNFTDIEGTPVPNGVVYQRYAVMVYGKFKVDASKVWSSK